MVMANVFVAGLIGGVLLERYAGARVATWRHALWTQVRRG